MAAPAVCHIADLLAMGQVGGCTERASTGPGELIVLEAGTQTGRDDNCGEHKTDAGACGELADVAPGLDARAFVVTMDLREVLAGDDGCCKIGFPGRTEAKRHAALLLLVMVLTRIGLRLVSSEPSRLLALLQPAIVLTGLEPKLVSAEAWRLPVLLLPAMVLTRLGLPMTSASVVKFLPTVFKHFSANFMLCSA